MFGRVSFYKRTWIQIIIAARLFKKVYRIDSISFGENLRNMYPWYYGRAERYQTKPDIKLLLKSAELKSVSSSIKA